MSGIVEHDIRLSGIFVGRLLDLVVDMQQAGFFIAADAILAILENVRRAEGVGQTGTK